MNKELRDLAWSVLPKEFKEEVKKLYSRFLFTREGYYDELFGKHNLTSDAEGEEMLMCSNLTCCRNGEGYLKKGQCDKIQCPNRSKCLPNNADSLSQNPPENCDNGNHISTDDNKPAEPKFKVGDCVFYPGGNGYISAVDSVENRRYSVFNLGTHVMVCGVRESDLKPYTEPDTSHETPVFENHSDNTSQKEVNMNSNRNLSQEPANCDKHFDTILKDSFLKERRLNIATQIMSAILSNQMMLNNLAHGETTAEGVVKCIVDTTIMYTDALLVECKKGGSDV